MNVLAYKIISTSDFEILRIILNKGEHTHYTACYNHSDYYIIDPEKMIVKDDATIPTYTKVADCTPIVNPYYKAPVSLDEPEMNTNPVEAIKELETPIEAPTIDYKDLCIKKDEEINKITAENKSLRNNLNRLIYIISKAESFKFSGSDLINIIKEE